MQDFYHTPGFIMFLIGVLALFIYLTRREIYQMFFGYGVPFVPTSDQKIDFIIENIDIKKGQHFLDLGSGDGKVLEALEVHLEKKYGKDHGISITGIENSPHPFGLSLEKKENNKRNFEVKKMDFFKEDFGKYEVVYTYMLPYLMGKIWKKMQKECKPGTLFYSNSFKLMGVEPIKKIPTKSKDFIYVYEIK